MTSAERRRRPQHEALVESAPDAVIVVDLDGRIVLANAEAERLFGYRRSELLGRQVEMLVPERFRGPHVHHRNAYLKEPRTRPMGIGLDLSALRRDGSETPIDVSLSTIEGDNGTLITAFIRDISDRRAAEAALRESEERVGMVEERERIARNLHDTVIQRLFATGMVLQGTEPLIERAEVRERLRRAVDDLDETIRAIRTTIFELEERGRARPGVRSEVLDVVAEAATSLGFQPVVRFEGPVDATLQAQTASQLLPTLREALSNVARHGQATRVDVTVEVSDGVTLRVTDDGVGIPTDERSTGHGLRNMRKRACALGGRLELSARPGGGTVLTWRVPSESRVETDETT